MYMLYFFKINIFPKALLDASVYYAENWFQKQYHSY